MISIDAYRAQWFGNIRADVLAGLVVALALIPEAIAFSIIAGVDPKVGLFASFSIAVITAITGGRPAMISAGTAATAVLMIDVARADHVFDDTELERVLALVEAHFELTPAAAAELVAHASDKAEELTSAYEFTRVLHEHLDADEEARIVGLLWQIAYADGELDKYEDSLVLKISDLLHVSRARVMRLKHDAELEARQRAM